MALNYTPTTLSDLSNEVTFLSEINLNFSELATLLQDALSRSGSLPNSWEADQDADSFDLNNLGNLTVGVIRTESFYLDGSEVPSLADVAALYELIKGELTSNLLVVDDITEMKALPGLVDGQTIKMATTGRAGSFVVIGNAADFAAEIAADPLEGVYVVTADDKVLMRTKFHQLTVGMFGGVGDGSSATEDTAAFQGLAGFVDQYPDTPFILEKAPIRWNINATVDWHSSVSSGASNSRYGIHAQDGCEIETTVVPMFRINPAGLGILEGFNMSNITTYINGKLGYSSGVMQVRRCRDGYYSNMGIRDRDRSSPFGDAAYLLEFDGSYHHVLDNGCYAFGPNVYLYEYSQNIASGEEDTCTHINDKNFSICAGFVRNAATGRHNFRFITHKTVARYSEYEAHHESTIVGAVGAGASSLVVSDAAGFVAGFAFLCGEGESAEVCVVDESYVGGTTIPLAFPTRFAKSNGEQVLWGGFGIHLNSCQLVQLKNPHFERCSSGVICDSSVRLLNIEDYICSARNLSFARAGGNDRAEYGSGRFASVDNWGAQYVRYESDVALAANNTLARYHGLIYVAPTSDTQNVQRSNNIDNVWDDRSDVHPVVTVTTGSASVGSGVTISVEPTTDYMEIGEEVWFTNGGTLSLTSSADVGSTSLSGDLSVSGVAAGEYATAALGILNDTFSAPATRLNDDEFAKSPSVIRVMVDNAVRAALRLDGSMKARQIFSHKNIEDGGTTTIANGASATIYSAADSNINEVAIVYCKTLGNQINIVSVITHNDAKNQVRIAELINTSTGSGASLSDSSGDLVLTNNTGASRDVYVGKIVINAGR